MGIRLLHDLKGGELLKEPVILEEEVLVPAGTALKPEYIELLKTLDVETVIVEESEEPERQFFFQEEREECVERVRKILERHIYGKEKNSLQEIASFADEFIEKASVLDESVSYDYEERQPDLYEHTVMTAALSFIITKRLQIPLKEQKEIVIGALLHDIGLRYITVNYVNQSIEERSDTELFEFKKHTILGYSALESEEWVPMLARRMVLSHHERKDGSGYPLKQKNQEMGCRILQVCDAFDGMVSGMECRRMELNDVLDYLKAQRGILFDEKVVDILLSLIRRKSDGNR